MSSNNPSLDRLYATKIQKLKEQKAVSDQMNDLLCKSGGLNDSSKLTCKNLKAAICVSKMPGYFEYYSTPEDLKKVEEKKVLNNLARNIQKLHKELEDINEEIAQSEIHLSPNKQQKQSNKDTNNLTTTTIALNSSSNLTLGSQVKSISEWYDVYGRPNITEEKKELMTSFNNNPKIYGGTNHFKSFKTTSTLMRKGRITR